MAQDEPSNDPLRGRSNGDPEPPGRPGHPVVDEVEVLEELLAQVVEESQPRPAPWFADLRGRSAIITGGATGIGRATALELAAHGVNVAFNYLGGENGVEDEARRTAMELRQLEVKVHSAHCDVRDSDAVKLFVDAVRERFGRIDILVNNAGIGRDRALWRMSDEEWDDVLATNLTGAFNMIRELAPDFRAQQDGKIVNVSSVHGIRPEFGLANYAASKAGLIGLTRSAAVELGPSNVNVNAVAPGYIRTTRLTDAVPAEILDRAREQSVLGRLGGPQDVAHVVLFLCSEQARHITGAAIPVDGGHLL
jgi:3-oxoacyl-[acyl-carrier protein] reductase